MKFPSPPNARVSIRSDVKIKSEEINIARLAIIIISHSEGKAKFRVNIYQLFSKEKSMKGNFFVFLSRSTIFTTISAVFPELELRLVQV